MGGCRIAEAKCTKMLKISTDPSDADTVETRMRVVEAAIAVWIEAELGRSSTGYRYAGPAVD